MSSAELKITRIKAWALALCPGDSWSPVLQGSYSGRPHPGVWEAGEGRTRAAQWRLCSVCSFHNWMLPCLAVLQRGRACCFKSTRSSGRPGWWRMPSNSLSQVDRVREGRLKYWTPKSFRDLEFESKCSPFHLTHLTQHWVIALKIRL